MITVMMAQEALARALMPRDRDAPGSFHNAAAERAIKELAEAGYEIVPCELPWEHAGHRTVLAALAEIEDGAPATGMRRLWAALMALHP
jgi:Asp-tRNA(Asn)/Glu-tRNA(Gln) amidotransferase A subunit family amidase